ncbi:MAG: 3-isopropylmalate dehydratase small subunit [Dehalococcoidia bacterium]|nr:3-isopropylmalate dehydratase small subunit [Dehalococcoidia bacterium]
MKIRGQAHVFGADINTDVIIPARYLNVSDAGELACHCMEDVDPGFISRVGPGDMIVAGTNFGCGSSREHAPLAIKAAGVSCVIARSFARIFYRNALNIGLPILECEEAVDKTEAGDTLEVDLSTGEIRNIDRKLVFRARPFPEFMLELIRAGGLIEYTKQKIALGGTS